MGHLKYLSSKTVLNEAFLKVGWDYKL